VVFNSVINVEEIIKAAIDVETGELNFLII
jgi:hypothetical protein